MLSPPLDFGGNLVHVKSGLDKVTVTAGQFTFRITQCVLTSVFVIVTVLLGYGFAAVGLNMDRS